MYKYLKITSRWWGGGIGLVKIELVLIWQVNELASIMFSLNVDFVGNLFKHSMLGKSNF